MVTHSAKHIKAGAHAVKRKAKGDTPQTAGAKPSGKKRRVPRAAKVLIGVLAAAAAGSFGFAYLYPNIFPGVTVGSIAVGGMNRASAADTIAAQSAPLYKAADVSVTIYETTYVIPVDSVLKEVDAGLSAENAYAVGRTGNPFSRVKSVILAACGKAEAQLAATVDEDGLSAALSDIADQALTEPVEPTWEIGEDSLTIHAGEPGVQFDTAAVEQTLAEKIRLMDFEPYEVSTELTETPAIDIDKIAEAVIGDAVSATVSKEDGKTIVNGKVGVQFDIDEAKKIIGDGSEKSYVIPITTTQPKVTAEDLSEKLFRDTLAQTVTYLDTSNTARTNNVTLASSSINGTILNPGEEFSYNNTVGERTEARGYKPAHAYVNGQIVDEFGGGVCQPSSTLYMAVLRADLEVTERHNHSYTVAYTPLGEDATVDYGNLDFRFRNDTDYPIKILASQSGGEVTMTIIGTKTSDKTVTTRTEVLETYSPQTIEKKDATMKSGESRVDVTGITGYSTRTYKQITVNGETTEELANTSKYDKRDKVVYVGAEEEKTKTDTETETTGGESDAEA